MRSRSQGSQAALWSRAASRWAASPIDAAPAACAGAETPNGNSVSLEDQMMRAAEVRQEHEMALGVYSKALDILRTTVTK